ncbi:SGNH/GDSL hydrolase family protein [Salinibacterium sp. ZJ70]|uniref:SGNH/GDSL hydrolase family protein n=1 Tax=Salinibacterium sp. ZJ70 TaxID=2708084 RepID=UPI001423D039|nr:SGNH/GDSL hydrolase family protein [Salinibacterium sp. ZJ70]
MPTPQHPSAPRATRLQLLLRAPRILKQKKALEASIEHLPEAARPWEGRVDGHSALRLVVAGDSTAAGVGVDTQDDGLAASVARELSARTGRGVMWRAIGSSGADTEHFLTYHLTDAIARPVDLVFVSLGANDALSARSARAYARDLRTLLETVSDRHPDALILVSNLPVFARFEVLPEPLRSVLHRHARALEHAAQTVVARDDRWMMTEALPPEYGPQFFARDGFHPSASGYADWARFAIDEAWTRGLRRIEHAGRQIDG